MNGRIACDWWKCANAFNNDKKMKKIIFALCLMFFLVEPALAHQPRLIFQLPNPTAENPIVIEKPEISQAFYGKLNGQPDYFELELNKPGEIYFSLLSPDIPNAYKDFQLFADEKLFLDGSKKEWTIFYEEFGGDNYWQGPQEKIQLPEGNHSLAVKNEKNQGKYVLVVGTEESFPVGEAWNAVKSLPSLKKDFFERSVFTAYSNRIGIFLAISILIFFAILVGIIFLIKKIKNNL